MFKNLRKFSEKFGNGSKVIFKCFYDFLKFSENLRKSSEVFGNPENFGKLRKRLKSNFQMFRWFFKIFGKSSEIFRKFPDVIGNVRNGSQELNSFGAGF